MILSNNPQSLANLIRAIYDPSMLITNNWLVTSWECGPFRINYNYVCVIHFANRGDDSYSFGFSQAQPNQYCPDPTHYLSNGVCLTLSDVLSNVNLDTCPQGFRPVSVTSATNNKVTQCRMPVNYNPKDNGCSGAKCDTDMQKGVILAADPVSVGSGNKQEMVTDYSYSSAYPLQYTRYYNTKTKQWNFEYNKTLIYAMTSFGSFINLNRPDGSIVGFSKLNNASNWSSTFASEGYSIISVTNTIIIIKNDNQETEYYDNYNTADPNNIDKSDFRLTSVKSVGGWNF